jgi:hypothetical protein
MLATKIYTIEELEKMHEVLSVFIQSRLFLWRDWIKEKYLCVSVVKNNYISATKSTCLSNCKRKDDLMSAEYKLSLYAFLFIAAWDRHFCPVDKRI